MTTPPKKTAQQIRDAQKKTDEAGTADAKARAPKGTVWSVRKKKKPEEG